MGVLNNSLDFLQLISLMGVTELDQVNLILIRHVEAGPLIKIWNLIATISSQTQESSKLLSCFGRKIRFL